nr:protransforming growth factor alpha isoform X2 [Geotrypetes seraphini]
MVCQALENTTAALSEPPMAAAVRSHFDDCPDSHSHFCFHGTCRFFIQDAKPACVCHPGYIGSRCEHADILAVVSDNHKQQIITVLVVVSVVACISLSALCILIHCCKLKQCCEGCRAVICRHEKPAGLLKDGASCCNSETVV